MSKLETCIRAGLVMMLGTQLVHAEELRPANRDAAAPQSEPSQDINLLRQQVAAQALKLAEQQRQIDESRRLLESLQKQLGIAAPAPGVKVAQASSPTQVDASTPAGPVGQPPAPKKDTRPPEIAPIFEGPGVLSPRGQFTVEPSLQYSYSSSDRVNIIGYTIVPALTIGVVDVRTVHRNTAVAGLTARYGLTNRLEVEARVPFVYRNDETITRPINLEPSSASKVFDADGYGIGDVELAARYQLNVPKPGNPYYLGGLRLKTRTGEDPFEVDYLGSAAIGLPILQTTLPTGTGFYTLQPTLGVIYPTDPAVFFGGINYQWNIKRDVNKYLKGLPIDSNNYVGEVDPGDAVGINVGMGLGLNERSSFSIGYEHTWYGESEQDGATPEGVTTVQTASLLLGYSYRLNKNTALNLSIAAGLTEDTPDTQFTLRLPFTF